MKSLTLFALIFSALYSPHASAAVKFEGGDWVYGSATKVVIAKIGIASSETETIRVVLNFSDKRQLILTENHVALGLSLTSFQGKCIKVLPGYRFESVSFVLSCED